MLRTPPGVPALSLYAVRLNHCDTMRHAFLTTTTAIDRADSVGTASKANHDSSCENFAGWLLQQGAIEIPWRA